MLKLLIVEDDPTLRNAYEIFFNKQGYDVRAANDGDEAMKLVKQDVPDAIILDILLPKMDGFEFLRKFKGEDKHPETKIIVLSNLNSPETKVEANKLGANVTLHKSDYAPKELLDVLEDVLKR